jgi:hypothetical protein
MLVDSQSGFAEQNLVMFNQTLGSGTDCQLWIFMVCVCTLWWVLMPSKNLKGHQA